MTLSKTTIRKSRLSGAALALALALLSATIPAAAQETYRPGEQVISVGGGFFGGGRALLTMPRGKPSTVVILMPGGDGDIGLSGDGSIARDSNWIVRTRGRYASAGIASLLLDAGADPSAAIRATRQIAPKVVLVAMSRGSTRVPPALSAGPDAVVFTSSMLDHVRQTVGLPNTLPPTLVIHHRRDDCHVTHYNMVQPFMEWASGRARLVWIDGGTSRGNPCRGQSYHGFVGREGAVVSAIVGFVRSQR
ncbi:MAG: hypothetical protein ACRCUE_15695 [Bosea sp. (in: a-proteobacteria)]